MKREDIENTLKNNPIVILYFSNSSCGACEIIRKKTGKIIASYEKVKIIDLAGEENAELAANYQVFAFPLMLIFVEGKEVARFGRHLDFLEVENMLARYSHLVEATT